MADTLTFSQSRWPAAARLFLPERVGRTREDRCHTTRRKTQFGINPREPLTLAAVSLFLCAAALIAIWTACRAAALDPLTSLRCE